MITTESSFKVLGRLGRLRILLALVLSLGLFPQPAWAEERVVAVKEGLPKARGQIVVNDENGGRLVTLTGFARPEQITYSADGRILVFDSIAREFYSLVEGGGGESGATFFIDRTWKLPPNAGDAVFISSTGRDVISIIDKRGDTYTIKDTESFDLIKAPSGITRVFDAAHLPDGGAIVVGIAAEGTEHRFFSVPASGGEWIPLRVTRSDSTEPLRSTGVAVYRDTLYLWNKGWIDLFSGKIVGNEVKLSQPQRIASGVDLLVPDLDGNLFIFSTGGEVMRFNQVFEKINEYQFITQLFSVAFNPKNKQFLLAYENPQIRHWPEIRNRIFANQETLFHWDRFWPIATVGSILALLSLFVGVRWGYEVIPIPLKRNQYLATHRFGWVLSIVLLALVASGIYLSWGAQGRLLAGLGKSEWLWSYILGAATFGVAVEVWRRWRGVLDEPRSLLKVIKDPVPAFGLAAIMPLFFMALCSAALFYMGTDQAYNRGYREGVFVVGLLSALSILIGDLLNCRAALKSWFLAEWPFFIAPLLVGVFTLFYRLVDVPYNTHFDFTSHTFISEQFLRGAKDGWWDWGFSPAPVIGNIPEIVGLLLGGFTPLGYRLGNSLFNLSAVLAVYLIGREYRNPRVGFWAAIILAGNAPFIHFGRLMSNGFAATVAVWAIAALILALKYKRSSLWLFMGLISGLAFYEWPVARVGMTAGAIMYGLVWLCSPLRMLKQVPQQVVGLLGVVLLIAPLIPIWISYPERLMPRAEASLPGLKLASSGLWIDLSPTTLDLFYRSLGWIFNEFDRSSQGSVSPGFNSVEAVLFASGLVILCIEGFSFNILLGLMLLVTLLVCGALAVGPPWYTRVLPSASIACLLIARALEGVHNLFNFGRRWIYWGVFGLITAGVLIISPYYNFKRYYDYETGVVPRNTFQSITAIGRSLDHYGPKYTYVFLILGEPNWRFGEVATFGLMFPYISNLSMRESYDVASELPVPPGRPTAFVIQVKRLEKDLALIKQHHPNASVVPVVSMNSEKVAYIVLVE